MRRTSRSVKLLSLAFGLALVASACGSDGDGGGDAGGGGGGSGSGGAGSEDIEGAASGGEFVDLGTFAAAAPPHIDPALTSELDGAQVSTAVYDGLTDIDFTGEDPVAEPLVAESVEPNEDASVWSFTLKEGLKFSDGTDVLPSSFVRGWERAADPELAADYGYLFSFIQGGAERLDGSADTIEGVVADDEAMTLEVTLSEPYADFDYIVSFQIFSPMPEAVEELDDQSDWENQVMIGNGPFAMESERSDQEIILVKNPEWTGNIFGDTEVKLDKLTFKVSQDVDSAYASFEAGEGDNANIPPARVTEAQETYATTLDTPYLGSYHFDIDMEDPVVGGEENKLLRQAISQSIDRDDINEAVYDGSRTTSTGITPEGIPGWEEGACDYCAYDPDAAEEAFDEWKAEGNEITEPIKIQFGTDAGHEDVVAIIADNMNAIGITAEIEPLDSETYFDQMRDGACQICRAGWIADYPTYDNFMFDLFDTSAIGGNNLGPYSNTEFDGLVADAKQELDVDKQGEIYREAEDILLNQDIGVIPINWYRGDYVYNPERVKVFEQAPNGLVLWERVAVEG
ncbi:MAG: ABC transporter substrate-binding protein [Actinomycetota bacterium]|nr:ABC transporter substrate-binding protein [Actinomycetota bacterium]